MSTTGTTITTARRGITIIELLVALALALMLITVLAVFLQDYGATRARIEHRSVRDRTVDALFDVMEGAVATSVLDAGDGGIAGDGRECTIHSAAVDPAKSAPPAGRPFAPATATWIGFDAADGSLLVRRGDGAAESLPLEGFALRFRYHDGTSWVDSFDSRALGRLPTAIEVSVWLDAPSGAAAGAALAPDPVNDDGAAIEGGGAAIEGRASIDGDAPIEDDAPTATADRRRVIAIPDSAPAGIPPVAGSRP